MKIALLILLVLPYYSFCHKNFILLGPPGAGKGTFSYYLVKNANYNHICPGDIIRENIRNATDLGKKIEPIVRRGDYISDDIVEEIIEDLVIESVKNNKPFLIDGYPRNHAGVAFLSNLLKKLHVDQQTIVIHFLVDDFACIDRIENRLICYTCYSVFNTKTRCPQVNFLCDYCGAALEVRLGDAVEVTKKRLAYYRNHIEPLKEVLGRVFEIIPFNAKESLDECIKMYTYCINL